MRLSCNGCRVLRKGCSDACTIRPCLQWIKSSDAQANATVFLAKFYGRAGLLNLIAAAPTDALRPAVFRSLLYEACGRIVNPVYGAVGLLWSGTWHMCQAAVEAVLKGAPIVQVDAAAAPPAPAQAAATATQSKDDRDRLLLHKVSKPHQLKRKSSSPSRLAADHHNDMLVLAEEHHAAAPSNCKSRSASSDDCDRHSASASLDTEEAASHVSQAMTTEPQQDAEAEQPPPSMGLDLTLGLLTSSAPPPAACSAAAVDEPAGVVGFRFL